MQERAKFSKNKLLYLQQVFYLWHEKSQHDKPLHDKPLLYDALLDTRMFHLLEVRELAIAAVPKPLLDVFESLVLFWLEFGETSTGVEVEARPCRNKRVLPNT